MRNKTFSFINIFGLAVGVACSLLIFLFVKDELSYDRFNKDADNIYRVARDFVNEEGSKIHEAKTPPALAVAMQRKIPEVVCATRAFANPDAGHDFLFKYGNKKFNEQKIFFIDSNFFNVFTLQFLKGNPHNALKDANSVVITESVAKKYFSNENPIGKTLQGDQLLGDLMVTGVIKDVPPNSHFHFNFGIPLSKFGGGGEDAEWRAYDFYTYVKVKPNTNIAAFTKKIQTICQQNDSVAENSYYTQPLTSIHLTSNLKEEIEPNSNKLYVYIFSIIAIFIILIAGINYVNLATAKAAMRTKEVGIRKVTGASRSSLVSQFLTESVITCLAACLLAVVIAQSLLPVVNTITQKQLTFINDPLILGYLFILALLLGIAAGIFPAIYLSSFKPVLVLKGVTVNSTGTLSLRKVLVVVQFTISIVLIAGALIITQQVQFMQSKTLGLNKDQVVIVKNIRETLSDADKDAFQNAALQINGVKKIAMCEAVLGGLNGYLFLHEQGSQNLQYVDFLSISDDYLDVLGIQLKEGRSFSAKFPTDIKHNPPDNQTNQMIGSVILNETAVKELGIKEPAVGKNIFWGQNYLRVAGVVKDFHFTSYHDKIKPFAFLDWPLRWGNFTIKLSSDNMKVTLAELQKTWNKFSPERPFDYFFLDDTYARLYQSEIHFEQVFTSLVILAILIACLGLFGLATFVAHQRVKEIGIRKVLGASVFSITKLLSLDFIKLVGISIIIATPVAWYAMNKWLEDYAYRINISWITFFIAGLLAIGIALFTISFQSIKAAIANPVKSLRTE
jgi:putative ABC transport system permease protein